MTYMMSMFNASFYNVKSHCKKKQTHISAIKLYKDLKKKEAVKDALQSGAQRFFVIQKTQRTSRKKE